MPSADSRDLRGAYVSVDPAREPGGVAIVTTVAGGEAYEGYVVDVIVLEDGVRPLTRWAYIMGDEDDDGL